ncbi:MAG TPA: hypothetical protein VK846_00015 [Candidatus Limnocylindria bacterium]|nr:hypothetical protein [Candidatus Limnocylindria bacterium]
MKMYLTVACAVLAFTGCARDRGGMRDQSGTQSGTSTEQGLTNTNNKLDSITNDSSGAPANATGTTSGSNYDEKSGANSTTGSTSDRSSGVGSNDNRPAGSNNSK